MTDKQQTAVQWLMDAMNGHLTEEDMRYVINKALAMEQQQIIDAYKHGQNNGYMYRDGNSNLITAEQYFTDTYQTEP